MRAIDIGRSVLLPAFLLGVAAVPHAGQQQPQFVAHEVATGLRGGYQVIATDMNKDGKPDLVAVASGVPDLVWFENPGWQRHVLATGLRGMINVAAADLDGDSIPELALAHGFAMTVAQSAGNLSLLTHGADVRQPWTIREIDRVPTAHRVRWMRAGGDAPGYWLLNAPLIGDSLRAPEYAGKTPIYMYRPPEWKRETVPGPEEGVVHSIELPPPGRGPQSAFMSASFLGVVVHNYGLGNPWFAMQVLPRQASTDNPGGGGRRQVSEIALLRTTGDDGTMATIEPWHGSTLAWYPRISSGDAARVVIDSTLTDAHTLVAADFDGDSRDEIVAGERGGARSVRIYKWSAGGAWTRTMLDAGAMAAAGCAVADLNGDGRIDIACIGTATANLKWYENVGGR